MKRNQLVVLMGIIASLSAVSVSASTLKGVTFPDTIQVAGTTLALNGLGLREATAFKVSVYVAALYVSQPSSDPSAILGAKTPKELTLHFLRNVDGPELSSAWEEGFAKNAKDQLPALKERIEKLKSFMADMKKGEKLTFIDTPGKGVEVNVNGTVKGTVEGDDFAKAFFSIWLGPAPPNPGLKAGLLGTAKG